MSLRIASWNINSVRLRLPLLQQLAAETSPDIICLQETKADDSVFPLAALKKLGYEYILFRGQKAYNGVAILSKIPLYPGDRPEFGGHNDARHIAAVLPGDIELHNFYVPAGGDEPNADTNPKYAHKLRFVEDMTAWFDKHRSASDRVIILGDLNIAPLEHDVWSHKQLLNVVSHTLPETERMTALQQTLGWIDSGRHFTPVDQKLYSWWSYRNHDWQKSDRGRRLDHIWLTPALRESLHSYYTIKTARAWEKPSDHVPVMVDVMVG